MGEDGSADVQHVLDVAAASERRWMGTELS